MANTKPINVIATVEHMIEGQLPSGLRPYAKALAAAVPALITAYGLLQAGPVGPTTVIQFIISVLTVGGVYLVPLVPDRKWESGLKTGVAIFGAVLSAGVAAIGNGGAQGWLAFGTSALAALLVEIVDNVPNAAPIVIASEQVAEDVLAKAAPAPAPAAPRGFTMGTTNATETKVSYSLTPNSPAVPLPTVDQISPEG